MKLSALGIVEHVEESLFQELAESDCDRLKGAETRRVLDFRIESARLNVKDSKVETLIGTLPVQCLPRPEGGLLSRRLSQFGTVPEGMTFYYLRSCKVSRPRDKGISAKGSGGYSTWRGNQMRIPNRRMTMED